MLHYAAELKYTPLSQRGSGWLNLISELEGAVESMQPSFNRSAGTFLCFLLLPRWLVATNRCKCDAYPVRRFPPAWLLFSLSILHMSSTTFAAKYLNPVYNVFHCEQDLDI
jgi:hypothetical protein